MAHPLLTRLLLLLLSAAASIDMARAAPIDADFSTCRPVSWPTYIHYDCCTLPALIHQPPKVKDYQTYLTQTKFSNARVRVRQAAHLVDDTFAEKYNRAYQLMRELPPEDPRSWIQQNNLHCLYGHPFLRDQKKSDKDYGIHKNWLLLPFHRWYLFFYERILATLIDDPDFAIPYWHWDSQQADSTPLPNAMPAILNDPVKYPALLDPLRDQYNTRPGNIINLSYQTEFHMDAQSVDELRDINNALMHQIMVEDSRHDRDIVFSYPQRYGEPIPTYGGYVEAGPHGAVHFWAGIATLEDMGVAYSAGRDPLFFSHHGNLDRLWNVWRSLEGGRDNYDDPDWYDAEFVLFDEMGELVRVRAGDAVDNVKLGYVYQEGNNTWVDYDMDKNPKVRDMVVQSVRKQPNQPANLISQQSHRGAATTAAA